MNNAPAPAALITATELATCDAGTLFQFHDAHDAVTYSLDGASVATHWVSLDLTDEDGYCTNVTVGLSEPIQLVS